MTNKTGRKMKGTTGADLSGSGGGTAVAERPRNAGRPRLVRVAVNWPQTGEGSCSQRYRMDEQNLAMRRQFIRLDAEDRALLHVVSGRLAVAWWCGNGVGSGGDV